MDIEEYVSGIYVIIGKVTTGNDQNAIAEFLGELRTKKVITKSKLENARNQLRILSKGSSKTKSEELQYKRLSDEESSLTLDLDIVNGAIDDLHMLLRLKAS